MKVRFAGNVRHSRYLRVLRGEMKVRFAGADGGYLRSQYDTLSRNTFWGCAAKRAARSRGKSKSPRAATSLRVCVQTRYAVEPGRHSQRSTPVPRSERRLKSGLPIVNGAAGPAPSGSML